MDESLLKKLELQIIHSIQQGLSFQKNHHQHNIIMNLFFIVLIGGQFIFMNHCYNRERARKKKKILLIENKNSEIFKKTPLSISMEIKWENKDVDDQIYKRKK